MWPSRHVELSEQIPWASCPDRELQPVTLASSTLNGIIIPVPTTSKADLYRKLPSVDELLRRPDLAAIVASEGQASVTDAARAVLARLRVGNCSRETGRGRR